MGEQTYNRALPTVATTSVTTSDTETVRRPRMGGKIGGNVLLTLADPQVLIATDLRDDLHAPEQGRGAIDKGGRTVEGIRHEAETP